MNYKELFEAINLDDKGLIPVIAQDYHSKKVRMLAYMNEEALHKTLETGKVHYYSRSRNTLWLKGETSGQYQHLKSLSIDCDGDTLLLQIEQVKGISCHTGHATCFYRMLEERAEEASSVVYATEEVTCNADKNSSAREEGTRLSNMADALEELTKVIKARRLTPKPGSYTNYLLDKGENKVLKKVGEECTEVIVAAKDHDKVGLIFEVADLIYHLTVLMTMQEVSWKEVGIELSKRK